MKIKGINNFFVILIAGFILITIAFLHIKVAYSDSAKFIIVIGTMLVLGDIFAIVIGTILFFYGCWGIEELRDRTGLGRPLQFGDLRPGRIQVSRLIEWELASVSEAREKISGDELRLLAISKRLGQAINAARSTIIEKTRYKKKDFPNLDRDRFFLEGDSIVRIVSEGELATERAEKASSKSSSRGCTA